MPTPATGVELLDVIGRSGLLPPSDLAGFTSDNRDPHALLGWMVDERLLTSFQARFLATGRYKGFFLGTKYKLLEHLGSGGMGEVYLGEQLPLHRLVAIKLLKGAKEGVATGATERFFREARAAAALKHPNIAQLYDVDSAATPYMVMEYVDGSNLHAVVAEHGRLSVPRAVSYAVQALRGLEHAHAAGLVHRDVKPGNLILDRSGGVKLLDLGLARYQQDAAKNANITAKYDENVLIGTADFIAPEQTQDSSAVDHRADIYSLGCTLYFFLAGRSPFENGTIAQKLLWHQLKAPAPLSDLRSDLPEGLTATVDWLMEKDRNARCPSATVAVERLTPWLDPRVPSPPSHEMPAVQAQQYRLGLVDAAPRFELQAAPSSDASVMPSALTIAPTTVQLAQAAHRRRSVRGTLMFAAVQLSLVALTAAVTLSLYQWANSGKMTPPIAKPLAPGRPAPPPLPAAGSTLVEQLLSEWTAGYTPGGGRAVAYSPVGSGNGVEALLAGRVRLAFTDTPVTAADAAGRSLVQVPVSLSAVVPVYNVPGVPAGLKLDGPTLADIYRGAITHWDDERILALNETAGMRPPHLRIVLVYRGGGSGTSVIFSDFLSKVSQEWAENHPPGKPLADIPGGVSTDTNADAAKRVNTTEGAIGYVELATAKSADLKVAAVRNAAERYPELTAGAVAAAAGDRAPDPSDPAGWSITNPEDKRAYPICGWTWAVFDEASEEDMIDILDFLQWVARDGQRKAEPLHYAPLPPKAATAVETQLRQVRKRLPVRK